MDSSWDVSAFFSRALYSRVVLHGKKKVLSSSCWAAAALQFHGQYLNEIWQNSTFHSTPKLEKKIDSFGILRQTSALGGKICINNTKKKKFAKRKNCAAFLCEENWNESFIRSCDLHVASPLTRTGPRRSRQPLSDSISECH